MIAIQLVSAQIGRVTGKGLAANFSQFAPRWLVIVIVSLLVSANTFNIAADIGAMGEALSLVIGGLTHEHALIFAAASVLLQVFVPYRRYAPVLKFLTLTLFGKLYPPAIQSSVSEQERRSRSSPYAIARDAIGRW